ncbi:MAG: glycoside hydrolase family 2 [Ruminococcaceae bacterium]|nr:glycoside hydrolase family 2 [Oscillospiraceae bacterium]
MDLYTPEGENLNGQPWNIYPRPMLVRDSFFCLNGMWDFAESPDAEIPAQFSEQIRVPFPPESLLSGIHRVPDENAYLYYRTAFILPEGFVKDRVILHFGAADQIAEVWCNGTPIGRHEGGYEAFSFDITDCLQAENTLMVKITDHLSDFVFPYGKQSRKPGGMWYTPVSGIWQTVWLESVPETFIQSLEIRCDTEKAEITVHGIEDGILTLETPDGVETVPVTVGKAIVSPANPVCWTPENPCLYHFTVQSGEDTVGSYFALRKLETKEIDGIPRLCLNGKPIFFHALLDQGYYSDGLFTPASPAGYTNDILLAKNLGFNTLRKHIKIEPAFFYAECDRLGMIVWQDMVNNGDYSFLRDSALPTVGLKKRNDRHLHKDPLTREKFIAGMESAVKQLANHPSVCGWTVFNEGWGQFCGSDMYAHLRKLDDSRFIDTASGWFGGVESDVISEHVYFRKFRFRPGKKPVFLSEFGGYVYRPEGHIFNPDKEYGYRFFKDRETFEDAFVRLYEEEILPAAKKGLCGAVYTQLSDIEEETNGLVSYDRRVVKVDPVRVKAIGDRLTNRE